MDCGGPEGETPQTATCLTRPPFVSPLLTSARALARTAGSGFIVFLLVLATASVWMAEYPVLIAGLSNPSGQFSSRLEVFLRSHLDDSLRCRVKDGLAAANGLDLQAKPKLITFQQDVQLASTDAQLLTDHLVTHTTMKRSNLFAANDKVLFFSRLCPERKLLSDSSSNPYRTEVTLSLPEVKSPGEIRTHTLGTESSIFPAPAVKKVRVRADMAKKSMSG